MNTTSQKCHLVKATSINSRKLFLFWSTTNLTLSIRHRKVTVISLWSRKSPTLKSLDHNLFVRHHFRKGSFSWVPYFPISSGIFMVEPFSKDAVLHKWWQYVSFLLGVIFLGVYFDTAVFAFYRYGHNDYF